MSIRVTVTDTETGESETAEIENDVLVITAGTCYIGGVQDYPTKGTQVYTIKGRRSAPAPGGSTSGGAA